MTRLFLSSFVVLFSLNAFGSGSSVHRAALDSLSCDTARDVVEDRGEVVFRFDRDKLSRVVRDRSFCDHSEHLFRFDYDVRDTRGCHVGYTCAPISGL